MSAAAATHGHDNADLRSCPVMFLPGAGAIIYVLGSADLAQEGSRLGRARWSEARFRSAPGRRRSCEILRSVSIFVLLSL